MFVFRGFIVRSETNHRIKIRKCPRNTPHVRGLFCLTIAWLPSQQVRELSLDSLHAARVPRASLLIWICPSRMEIDSPVFSKLCYSLLVLQRDIVVIIWYLDRCLDFTEPSTIFSSCWHCSLFSGDAPATVCSVIMTQPLSLSLSFCNSLHLLSLQTGAWTTADTDAERQTLPTPFLKVKEEAAASVMSLSFSPLTVSLPVCRHGRHHLLPGRHPRANESQVPGLWGVNVSPQVVLHTGRRATLLLSVTLMHENTPL